ncbi:orotidine-5'-phosphate decarboxylase [Salinibacillus kushneri]|uniref:Orotidine 5'-phosphate decarboxylase n=1 Tax=Salinibacillus kushneri TaxID=237682 RepID=A0A1I0HN84_9BACI|nr:orotidine-5'-phosphate decarboxylase [Salinibacillus kushneri]SET84600.1 orotidine-5'-phosphate decarboxylase [Salinibacillus kushneri]
MNKPVYLALDFQTLSEATAFLQNNELQGVPVKVGMELFYREGPKVIEELKKNEHPIFLDLKLHDIPNTVKSAMKNLASIGVDIVNVHTAGGLHMMTAAKEGLDRGTNANVKPPLLLAVTQLTSTDEKMLNRELGISWSMNRTIEEYAALACQSGVDGVICSVHEVPLIKKACGRAFLTCTPGIRFDDDRLEDQKRVATPRDAKQRGSDMIVMGRSITRAIHPKKQYERVVKEWKDE